MIEELERLTREYFDVETEHNPHSHLDYAIAQIESGESITSIASSLGDTLKVPIQRQVLSRYLHGLSSDAEERLAKARPAMTHAMAESAVVLIDQAPADKLDLAHNAAKARTRENIAKMLNPEFQANKQATNVQFNIGSLHLRALTHPTFAPHARVSLEPDRQVGALMAPIEVSAVSSVTNQAPAPTHVTATRTGG